MLLQNEEEKKKKCIIVGKFIVLWRERLNNMLVEGLDIDYSIVNLTTRLCKNIAVIPT
jgi:hypothetical protein